MLQIQNRDYKPPLLNRNSVSEIIRAEDLVNILWLINPNVKINLNNEELIEMGLSKLVASTI